MTRKISRGLGVASIVVGVLLWVLNIHDVRVDPRMEFLEAYCFVPLLVLSLILPLLAAWKSSKCWLWMLLNPLVVYVSVITNMC